MSISSRIERVRAEDLLEEEQPTQRAVRGGVGARRRAAGLVVGLLGLPLLTLVLDHSSVSLESVVLLYLVVVVAMAAIGGLPVAIAGAVAAAMLINYFFVDPVHTLDIERRHQALALGVFLVVAIVVSAGFDLAARRARTAEQAVAQAETLSGLAGGDLDEASSLKEVLSRARDAFQMESVVLKVRERADEPWVDVERSGWGPPGREAPLQFDVPISRRLRLVGRGPVLFAEDQRVLAAFAAAAQTAYEGRRLSAQARTAKSLAEADRQRTALLAAGARELQAPLDDIAAATGGLREAADPRLLDVIDASARRVRRIAADLLDAGRLQAGELPVDARPVALTDAVSAALEEMAGPSGRIRVDLPAALPPVLGDPGLLERAIANLLEDALRGEGEHAVDVTATAGASSARIEIVNHGAGTAEPADHVGLAVAHAFVEAMGGALVSDAGPDGSVTTRLRLPLARG